MTWILYSGGNLTGADWVKGRIVYDSREKKKGEKGEERERQEQEERDRERIYIERMEDSHKKTEK